MQILLCFLLVSFLISPAFPHDQCDRENIRRALQMAKNSKEALKLAKSAHEKVPRPARKNLRQVFKKVEKAVFGRDVLRIQEDLPMIPPMSSINEAGVISMSPQTLDSLNQLLQSPPAGAAFIISHEMGHLVQKISFQNTAKHLSPSGFKDASPEGNEENFNQLHAETDCIAVEILHMAGYPITDDVLKTLQIIKEECKTQRSAEFCNAADEIRTATVRNYIQKNYGSSHLNQKVESRKIDPPPSPQPTSKAVH